MRTPAITRIILGLLALVALQAAVAAETPFDHLTTGYELTGAHRDVPCESCHVRGVFKGTPRACEACHSSGTSVAATPKPASHIASTDRCESCHTTTAYTPASRFDHADVLGSCSSCHNNSSATGKPAGHIATTQDCGF